MTETLKNIQDIYEAAKEGNIGKLLKLIDEKIVIRLSKSLGGIYQGREGILEVVSKMCSSSNHVKKIINKFIVSDADIIVTGDMEFSTDFLSIHKIPFVDVWKTKENSITEVQIFYLDSDDFIDCLAIYGK